MAISPTTRQRTDLQRWFAAILRRATLPGPEALSRHVADAEREGVAALLDDIVAAAAPNRGDAGAARDRALRAAALEARRTVALARALDDLGAAGVPALLFKGAALAHTHYARPELRPRDDADVLIRGRHLTAADTVLRRLEYTPLPGNEGSLIMRQRLYRRHDADGVLHNLDLHWAISNSARARAFPPRWLMARAVPIPALGTNARAPAPADALLIACLHLDAHHRADVRLVWLYDIHLLVRDASPQERREAARRAASIGLAKSCSWVLAWTRELFGTGMEGLESVLGAAASRPRAEPRLAQWLRELGELPDHRARLAWLGQHAFPPASQLHRDETLPLPLRHLLRIARGVRHLASR